MGIRTDLVIDNINTNANNISGTKVKVETVDNVKLTSVKVIDKSAADMLKKPVGDYITVEFASLLYSADYTPIKSAIVKSLKVLLPDNYGCILIAGLGNTDITPDCIGPNTVNGILATRHIAGEFATSIGLDGLKSVAAIAPGVLGKTGVEVMELIAGTVDRIKPDAVIVVDALAAGSKDRLFTTVQLCNTGISPGSGVKNSRKEISSNTLGVPVIAVGVPTVVDAETLAYELTGKQPQKSSGMIVTPKEIDMLCERMCEILSSSLNQFLQPMIDPEILSGLV